ncbi:MAG: polymer-forming cytoskeletal protein [Gammaproteobacteria bacterium]
MNLGRSKGRRTLDKVEGFSTVIGKDSFFSGTIGGAGNYIIHGKVEGDCDIEGTMVIAENGHWVGNIAAACVLIAGTVEGDVSAKDKMEIISTARIKGKITSAVLAIAEGAIHEGVVAMAAKPDVKRFKDKRDPSNVGNTVSDSVQVQSKNIA